MSTATGDLIKSARAEHPAFTVERHPNVVALSYLSTRHRLLFKTVAHDLRDRLSTARSIAAKPAGTLVGVDAAGNAYPLAVSGPNVIVGDYINVGGDAVPYVGANASFVDPSLGGFPLPDQSIEIIDIYATLTDGVNIPVIWRPQGDAPKLTGLSGLIATVIGWRLIPVKNPKDLTTFWDQVVTVTVVWIDEPAAFSTLTNELAIPSVYGRVLEYELAAFFARRELALDPKFPPGLVTFYETQAQSERQGMRDLAILDHLPVKRITTKRNR